LINGAHSSSNIKIDHAGSTGARKFSTPKIAHSHHMAENLHNLTLLISKCMGDSKVAIQLAIQNMSNLLLLSPIVLHSIVDTSKVQYQPQTVSKSL
jgi:hypothetical protein